MCSRAKDKNDWPGSYSQTQNHRKTQETQKKTGMSTAKSKSDSKKSKKKRTIESISSLCNISGFDDSNPFAENNIQLGDCLDLLDQANSSAAETKEKAKHPERSHDLQYSSELWRGIGSSKRHMSLNLEDNFEIPNIQVELARHKHVGELSKFLLSKCSHLRMPSFERWLIDSKIEEHAKRKFVKENQEVKVAQDSADINKKAHRKDKSMKRLKRKNLIEKTALEGHLTSSGQRVALEYDPVVPSMADVEDEASQRLIAEIQRGEDQIVEPRSIVKELCKMSCNAARMLQNLEHHLGNGCKVYQYFGKSNNNVGKITLERDDDSSGSYSLVYSRKTKSDATSKPKPFVVKINVDHYEKLRDMFHSVHDSNAGSTRSLYVPSPDQLGSNPASYSAATNIFHHLVFCLLLRYASLAGAQQLLDLRGGGMQGAIHSEVFDCISDFSNHPNETIMECFASPLNVFNSQYCSIFHRDIDFHFGSVGDFFALPIGFFQRHGVHEANPPFSPGLMQAMVNQMEKHLAHASAKGICLTFLVVVPTCKKIQDGNLVHEFAFNSFKNMIRSKFFSKHIELSAREHGYIEGSQHLRPTRFKESQYNTSIIILQSSPAKENDTNLCGKDFEAKIREAFSSRHKMELLDRKGTKDDLNTM